MIAVALYDLDDLDDVVDWFEPIDLDDGLGRGILNALPIGALLWAVIIAAVMSIV
jgi:hypothetical protein